MINPTLYDEYTYLVLSAGLAAIEWASVEEIKVKEDGKSAVTRFTLITDQAGLIGFLRALYNRGIPLISVKIKNGGIEDENKS